MTIKKKGLLDKLPAPVRHCVILSGGVLLTWIGTVATTLPQPIPELAAIVLTMGTLYITKLTRQYGLKK